MTELKIEGMSCQHCVAAVNEALAEVNGVERVVDVDLNSGIAKIEGDADTEALLAAVREEGYEATMA
ncbi:CopZ family metallochaperone [Salinisphaera hydrothermalis]|nr:cation transporter [Salinisphaera hydrothermalis]